MLYRSPRRLQRYGFVTLSLLVLCSCGPLTGLFSPAPTHKVKSTKVQKIDAAQFVEHLSIAHITLASGGSPSDIADDEKIIENFSNQKKSKATSLILALLEYNDNEGKTVRAIAPISDSNFTALSNVLTPLGRTSYTLKEVRVSGVVVAPGMPVKMTGKDTTAATQVIETRYQAILGSAHKIPALQEAKWQLALLHYFTGAQQRDAAYISADNAKHLISTIPQDGSNAIATNQLAKELETAEGTLRQAMPY